MTTYTQLTIQDAIINQELKKDVIVTIEQDDCTENPRTWNDFDHMVCYHKRYNLGDKTNLKVGDYDTWEEFAEHIIKEEHAHVILPVYMYDHGSISLSTGKFSCQWDSGQVGFIYATSETIRKWFNVKRITKKIIKQVTIMLESSVSEYDDYLNGNVYWYSITDKHTGDELDSCGGFYGDDYIKDIKEHAGLETLYKSYEIVEK